MHLEGENSTVDNFEFSTIVGIFDFRLSTFDFRHSTVGIRFDFRHLWHFRLSAFDIYAFMNPSCSSTGLDAAG